MEDYLCLKLEKDCLKLIVAQLIALQCVLKKIMINGKTESYFLKRDKSEIPSALADGMNDGEQLYVSNNWKSKNRRKYLLQYHLIFVCKYRKKLFLNQNISDDIKQ